jgi:hypothetical protein
LVHFCVSGWFDLMGIIYRILLNLTCFKDCETFILNALVGQLLFCGILCESFWGLCALFI